MRRTLIFSLALTVLAPFCQMNAHASSSPSFKISGPQTALTIQNSSSASIPIAVVPVNGFTGGVDLQCGLYSAPPGAGGVPICGFPIVLPTVTITNTKPAYATLSISTGGIVLPGFAVGTIDRHGSSRYLALIIFPAIALLIGLRNIVFRKNYFALRCALVAGLLTVVGCGGGNKPEVTPGSYSYKIIGYDAATGGTITASTIITINIP